MSGFKAVTTISDSDMADIVTTGFESGSYGSVCIAGYQSTKNRTVAPKWADYPDIRHTWWWAVGDIRVVDKYGDDESGLINRTTLQTGFALLQSKWPHLAAQLTSGDYDVIAADALLQCAAFGDLIYG